MISPKAQEYREELVKKCYEAGIEVIPVPGACAAVNALIASGQPTRRFTFEAFLPTDKKERSKVLEELKGETRTIIIYEAPHRLVRTLKELGDVLGDKEATICRELTKKHETFFKTTLLKAYEYYNENEPKGECIIVIRGILYEELERESLSKWEEISIPEHLKLYMDKGVDKKEAAKLVAKDRGVSKREIYEYTIDIHN